MSRMKVAALAPIAAFALLATAGCLGDGGEAETARGDGGGQQAGQPGSAAQDGGQAPAKGGGDGGAGGGDKVLASRDFQEETLGTAVRLRLDITGLRRQGQLATLNFTITNNGSKFWDPHDALGDPNVQENSDLSGVTLVDPQNAKRYRVARAAGSPNGACVCSSTKSTNIAEQGAASFYATFPAPPAQLRSINVEIPLVGVINDVPIS